MKPINFTKKDWKYIWGSLKDKIETLEDGEYTIIIKKKKKIRSLPQNNYYWWVVIPILSEYTGYEPDFMHEILKSLFLTQTKIKNPFDKRKKIIQEESTKELDTKDFTIFIDKIRAKFHEVNIPLPEDKNALSAYEYYSNF